MWKLKVVRMKNIRKKWYGATPKSKRSAWVVGHGVGRMEPGLTKEKKAFYSWESERRPSSNKNNINRSTEPGSQSQTESECQRHSLFPKPHFTRAAWGSDWGSNLPWPGHRSSQHGGDGPVSKNMGQDSDAADWSRGSLNRGKRDLGWTQEHDYKNQETWELNTKRNYSSAPIGFQKYTPGSHRLRVHTCASVPETEGSSGWSLEGPPFQQSVIYRFKEHLTIDHKAFLLPSPARQKTKLQW